MGNHWSQAQPLNDWLHQAAPNAAGQSESAQSQTPMDQFAYDAFCDSDVLSCQAAIRMEPWTRFVGLNEVIQTDVSFAVFFLMAVASTSASCIGLQLASVNSTDAPKDIFVPRSGFIDPEQFVRQRARSVL